MKMLENLDYKLLITAHNAVVGTENKLNVSVVNIEMRPRANDNRAVGAYQTLINYDTDRERDAFIENSEPERADEIAALRHKTYRDLRVGDRYCRVFSVNMN